MNEPELYDICISININQELSFESIFYMGSTVKNVPDSGGFAKHLSYLYKILNASKKHFSKFRMYAKKNV